MEYSLGKTTLAEKRERIQRAALIGNCGALQIIPTMTLNFILHRAIVDIAAGALLQRYSEMLDI